MKLIQKKILSTLTIAVLLSLVNVRIISFLGTAFICLFIAWKVSDSLFRRISKDSDLTIDPSNKSVLVTGCDTGFGHLLAIKLASYGFKVYATCLDSNSDGAIKLKEIKNLCVIQTDVRSDKDVCAAVEEIEKDIKSNRKCNLLPFCWAMKLISF